MIPALFKTLYSGRGSASTSNNPNRQSFLQEFLGNWSSGGENSQQASPNPAMYNNYARNMIVPANGGQRVGDGIRRIVSTVLTGGVA